MNVFVRVGVRPHVARTEQSTRRSLPKCQVTTEKLETPLVCILLHIWCRHHFAFVLIAISFSYGVIYILQSLRTCCPRGQQSACITEWPADLLTGDSKFTRV